MNILYLHEELRNNPLLRGFAFVGKRSANAYSGQENKCPIIKMKLIALYEIIQEEVNRYENCLSIEDL